MKRLLIVILTFAISSCMDGRLERYDRLVDRSDKIVIKNREHADSIVLTAIGLDNLKKVLKRNIQPKSPRLFMFNKSILLYEQGKEIGDLLVSYGPKSYVNFRSDSLNLTFPLIYGLGMSLDNLTSKKSH